MKSSFLDFRPKSFVHEISQFEFIHTFKFVLSPANRFKPFLFSKTSTGKTAVLAKLTTVLMAIQICRLCAKISAAFEGAKSMRTAKVSTLSASSFQGQYQAWIT